MAYRQRHVIYIASGPQPPQPQPQPQPQQAVYPKLAPHVCLLMLQRMDPSGQQRMAARDTRSSARRRRERRLRAQWRHEQQTVAMALAVATHHSAQRGEWRDLYEAPWGQRTASAESTYDALQSQTTSVARHTEFFSLYEEELGSTRPDRLCEVRPQDRVHRRAEEQIVDSTLIVQSLDVLEPQMENQLVEVCWQLGTHVPEQAIEVPKISSTPRHSRRRRVRFAGADGRTVGSADDHIQLFVARACGAERGHSSSSGSWSCRW